MTLEELLESDSETLAKMTDEQLLEFFKPVLSITRPEHVTITKAVEASPKYKKIPADQRKNAKMLEAQAILANLGIKL